MSKINALRLQAKKITLALALLAMLFVGGVVKANESSTVYALVAYNGNNLPMNVSMDKTAEFERKYDRHDDIDRVLSNWSFIGFEVIVMVSLIALLVEIKRAIPKVEDALKLTRKGA